MSHLGRKQDNAVNVCKKKAMSKICDYRKHVTIAQSPAARNYLQQRSIEQEMIQQVVNMQYTSFRCMHKERYPDII